MIPISFSHRCFPLLQVARLTTNICLGLVLVVSGAWHPQFFLAYRFAQRLLAHSKGHCCVAPYLFCRIPFKILSWKSARTRFFRGLPKGEQMFQLFRIKPPPSIQRTAFSSGFLPDTTTLIKRVNCMYRLLD